MGKEDVTEQTTEARRMPKNGMFMASHQLDATDLLILATLQDDGRITNVDLCKKTRITAPPCLRRTRTLEDKGYIKSYHAKLDAQKLGYDVSAFVLVGLSTQTRSELRDFAEAVRTWPAVRGCHALSGESDFILRCVTTSIDTLQHFVTTTLMKWPSVKMLKTMLVMGVMKDEPDVPFSAGHAALPISSAAPLGPRKESDLSTAVL